MAGGGGRSDPGVKRYSNRQRKNEAVSKDVLAMMLMTGVVVME